MNQRGGRWSLGVALLLGSVSSGLGALPAGHAAAITSVAPHAGRGAAWGRPALRRVLAQSAPAHAQAMPTLGSSSPFTWTQQAELTSTAEVPDDGYGEAVALSANTAVVGAAYAPPGSAFGAAYIFARSGSTWTQQAELTDPGGVPNDEFGYAVAASGDTIVIGAPGTTAAAAASGAAYVYGRSGSTWTQQATLTATDGAYNDELGNSVAISGSTIVVGAFGKDNGSGAVYLFGRVGGVWQQQGEFLDPSHTSYADFGYAVALSGQTAVVSAVHEPVAYVYVRSGGVWALQGVLHAAHAPGLYFGTSVAVSGDTALVGACCDALGRLNGAVYVFGRSGSVWTLLATIPPPPGASGNEFGEGVALSGATAVLGGYGEWIYVGQGSTWAEQAPLSPSDRPSYYLGYAVAVLGNTALVGSTTVPPAGFVFVRRRVGDAAPADDSGTDSGMR